MSLNSFDVQILLDLYSIKKKNNQLLLKYAYALNIYNIYKNV